MSRGDPEQVIGYWFGELRDGLADETHRKRWFKPDAAVDADIRERFAHLLPAAQSGELDRWQRSPRDALALVLVCDQFSRQIHRGSREAYATDALAMAVARKLVEAGLDQSLSLDERAFLYMPFQHSESRLDQHTAVGLYTGLRDSVPAAQQHHAEGFLDHARQHRDIVLRFGRFPHRNRTLGRESTAQEEAFLENASDYGQSAKPRP